MPLYFISIYGLMEDIKIKTLDSHEWKDIYSLLNTSLLKDYLVYLKRIERLTSLGEEDFVPRKPSGAVAVAFLLAYGLIIAAAFIGNVLVIALLCKNLRLRAVTDLFLVWLAVADLLVAGVNMPLQLYTILHPEWTLGEPACKFKEYFQSVTIISSILTLSAIALDRYLAICHPLAMRGVHTRRYAAFIVLVIWLTACLVSVPQILISIVDSARLVRNDQGQIYRLGSICTEYFHGARMNQRLYSILTYVFYHILPVLVIVLAYGAVIRVLWARQAFSAETQVQALLRTLQKRRLVKMLLAIVVAFVACWFPFFTATLIRSLKTDVRRFMVKSRLHAILQLIGYANTCVNPVIYTLMSPRMKKSLKEHLSNICPRCCCNEQDKRVAPSVVSANTQRNCLPDSSIGRVGPESSRGYFHDDRVPDLSSKVHPSSTENSRPIHINDIEPTPKRSA